MAEQKDHTLGDPKGSADLLTGSVSAHLFKWTLWGRRGRRGTNVRVRVVKFVLGAVHF